MCLGTLANFPQNGHLRANLRSSQTRKVEDGAGECLNLSCFFHYCDKGLFFFFPPVFAFNLRSSKENTHHSKQVSLGHFSFQPPVLPVTLV